ncbi:MAG: PilT/PilU family type 4a pilus ATPase [Candidatus Auribacterota bacterium]|jgi:twitching motility protein PilT|nr:PilT/PilU family type 4a pilus ATPase [Candidatus Auribacterota bacterium]
MARLDGYLKLLAEHGASDLHMVPQETPMLRLHGVLRRTSLPKLTSEGNKKLLYEILDNNQIRTFEMENDVDFSYEIKGVARFRGNIFRQNNGISAVFRIIPSHIQSVNELKVPQTIQDFTLLKNGLVLVTGPTGSGKSTTLASLIDLINTTKRAHIITIEDPLEFVHEEKQSIITHREVGRHTHCFANALRAAMREDPDVIMVGEMRDLETISLALTAAEMGVLVFGTLHTNSAPKTINRIIDVFPENQQEQIRTMLASSLKGVVAQQLLEKKGGKGRVAAYEILVVNSGVANLIREGKSHQISSMMETNKKEGNCTMDQTLMQLYNDQKVTAAQAYRKSLNKKLFENLVNDADMTGENIKHDENVDEVLQVSLPDEGVYQEEKLGRLVESVMDIEQEVNSQKDTVLLSPDDIKPDPVQSSASVAKVTSPPLFDEFAKQPAEAEIPDILTLEELQISIRNEIESANSSGIGFSLIIIEFDGFGNYKGSKDEVLSVMASCLHDNDLICEANEQVYLLLCPKTGSSVDSLSAKLFETLSAFFNEHKSNGEVSVRVGDAVYPDSGSDEDQLIESASSIKYY